MLIVLIGITIFVNNTVSDSVKNNFINSTNKEIKQVINVVQILFQNAKYGCKYLATHPTIKKADKTITSYQYVNHVTKKITPSLNGGIEQKIYKIYYHFAKTHPQYRYIYMATKSQGYIQWPQGQVMKNYTPTKRPYYITAIKNKGKIVHTAPYYFKNDDVVIISTVSTIKDKKGKVIGVQGVDVSLAGLTNIIKNMKIGKTGYVVLVDNNGTILANPQNPKMNFKKYKALKINKFDNLLSQNKFSTEVIYNKKKYLTNVITEPKSKWKFIAFVSKSELLQEARSVTRIIWTIIIGFMVILIPIIIIVSFSFTRPLNKLMEVMAKMQDGDMNIRAEIKTLDEIGELASSYNILADELQIHMDELEFRVAERTKELQEINDKMLNDLDIAKKIQETIIKTLPETPELLVDAKYVSMESLGGDVYDIRRIGRSTYSFLIADVSGHGVPAALITTMAKTSFINHGSWQKSTAQTCSDVNKDLYGLIGDTDHYLTAFYVSLDVEKLTMSYTNCGHHEALIFDSLNNDLKTIEMPGTFIGIVPDPGFETATIDIKIGDKIFLFTDGIPEARNENGEFYTNDRLNKFVKEFGHLEPEEFLKKLDADLKSFCGDRTPDDDRAFLVIEILKTSEFSKTNKAQELPEPLQEHKNEFFNQKDMNIINKAIKMLNLHNRSLNSQINNSIRKINENKFEEAAEILQPINQFFPDNVRILNSLAVLEFKQKNHSKSLEYFEKLKQIDPDYKNIDRSIEKIKSIIKEENGDLIKEEIR